MNQPFRITIEHHNQKVSVEINHSDIDLEELARTLKQVCMAAGWSEELISEIITI